MINIYVHGADPEDIRYDPDVEEHTPASDDAIAIANDIHHLLREDYGYLDVTGVEVEVNDVVAESG